MWAERKKHTSDSLENREGILEKEASKLASGLPIIGPIKGPIKGPTIGAKKPPPPGPCRIFLFLELTL